MLASKKKQNKIHLKFVKIKNCQSTGKNNLSYTGLTILTH